MDLRVIDKSEFDVNPWDRLVHDIKLWVITDSDHRRVIAYTLDDVCVMFQGAKQDALCDAPNSVHGVKRGCHFFPIYYKLINFKFVHSYNVKHLTCNIFCSSRL